MSVFFCGFGIAITWAWSIYKVKQKEYQWNGIDSMMQLRFFTFFYSAEVFNVWKNALQYLK